MTKSNNKFLNEISALLKIKTIIWLSLFRVININGTFGTMGKLQVFDW